MGFYNPIIFYTYTVYVIVPCGNSLHLSLRKNNNLLNPESAFAQYYKAILLYTSFIYSKTILHALLLLALRFKTVHGAILYLALHKLRAVLYNSLSLTSLSLILGLTVLYVVASNTVTFPSLPVATYNLFDSGR